MNKKYVLIMSLVCINVFSMGRGGAMSSKGPKKGSPAARATGEKKAEFFKAPEFDDEYVIDSVLQSAPDEIKQWSAAIKHNHETGPILLCGASGVGKTALAKAVSHDTESGLCYIGMPEICRFDWKDGFDINWLRSLDKQHVVIVDNITRLADDDVENLQAIVDVCVSNPHVHLLAIACDAHVMPAGLLQKFKPVKLSVPNKQERKRLFKLLTEIKKNHLDVADEIDDAYLDSFCEGMDGYTPRDISSLLFKAKMIWRQEDKSSKKMTLSRRYLESAKVELDEEEAV